MDNLTDFALYKREKAQRADGAISAEEKSYVFPETLEGYIEEMKGRIPFPVTDNLLDDVMTSLHHAAATSHPLRLIRPSDRSLNEQFFTEPSSMRSEELMERFVATLSFLGIFRQAINTAREYDRAGRKSRIPRSVSDRFPEDATSLNTILLLPSEDPAHKYRYELISRFLRQARRRHFRRVAELEKEALSPAGASLEEMRADCHDAGMEMLRRYVTVGMFLLIVDAVKSHEKEDPSYPDGDDDKLPF